MTEVQPRSPYRLVASVLLLFPGLFALVFLLHFHSWQDFAHIRWQYVPRAPERVVANLIAAANRWPMVHDPHVIAYLGLPLFILSGWALHAVGRVHRPRASAWAFFLTLTGTIYLGGLFGMWTAFYRGLGNVDPKYTEGATAAFIGMTTPSGAFALTTTLAKLAFVGLAVQALVLLRTRAIPSLSIASICLGCALFLAFWDLDNWMLVGILLIGAGLWSVRRRLMELGATR